MVSLRPRMEKLLKELPLPPAHPGQLETLVAQTLEDAKGQARSENWKNQWEYLLRNEIFKLAGTEGAALNTNDVAYYDELRDKLDIVLIFTEHDACEQTFPFLILQDLLETQTIPSCSQIFSWIEDRAGRLTKGMVPQKGKALFLLRTLNDLLRRLSKMGDTTKFCGRILTFLSGVFPLGERSGVNLRGEYGPTWEGVKFGDDDIASSEAKGADVEMAPASAETEPESQDTQMQVDRKELPKTTEQEKKEEFYNTFWSLQLYFSKPTEFATKGALDVFRDSINKVLPVIKEATAKERAMMGSRNLAGTNASLKRKRDQESEESNANEYFFAKFLTSPELLDLEIADVHFRRQFLFQLYILLHHLLTFSKEAKENWATLRNRSLQMDFVLEPEDATWVQDLISKVTEELRQTTPNGRQFSDTVAVILDRERNWVKWKNEICVPFDKGPWNEEVDGQRVGMFTATKVARGEMQSSPEPWQWNLGTEPLTEIWAMGYRDLWDLQNPFRPGDIKDFVKRVKQTDARIEMRKRQLAMAAERVAQAQAKAAAARAAAAAAETGESDQPMDSETPSENTLEQPKPVSTSANSSLHPSLPPRPGSPTKGSSSPPHPSSTPQPAQTPKPPAPAAITSTDEQILKFQADKQRITWLALRTLREQHLQHFAKIGSGDLELLAQAIDNAEKAPSQRGESVDETVETAGDSNPKQPPLKVGCLIPSFAYTNRALPVDRLGDRRGWLRRTRRYKIVSIDNYRNSKREALNRVSHLSKSELPCNPTKQELESTEIDCYDCDLSHLEQVRAVFTRYGDGGIWGVVHIAALKAVGDSAEMPLEYYSNNVAASIVLFRVMNEFGCRRLVYSSSATVYGTPPAVPIAESTRLQADSPYGRTKVMVEQIVEDLCKCMVFLLLVCQSSDTANQRTPDGERYLSGTSTGAHPSGVIGEDPLGRPVNLLPLLAHIAIGRASNITLQIYGSDYPTPDGTCVRDYLHVMDLANGHVLALDALSPRSSVFGPATETFYKAFNLGRGKGTSVLQVVEAMRQITGLPYRYELVGRRLGDVPNLTADPSVAERELGFVASRDLQSICRDLWYWQTKNPNGYTQTQASQAGHPQTRSLLRFGFQANWDKRYIAGSNVVGERDCLNFTRNVSTSNANDRLAMKQNDVAIGRDKENAYTSEFSSTNLPHALFIVPEAFTQLSM
ncbi:UDP-glucose epimerase [Coprinopsis sp. MPI-PUGE-AT-0042]|nr:UDP-glucose epimerase [Coprinopsis sp. MPI-PUGE-AT-0042]